jgi:hypothetical protein
MQVDMTIDAINPCGIPNRVRSGASDEFSSCVWVVSYRCLYNSIKVYLQINKTTHLKFHCLFRHCCDCCNVDDRG